MAVRAGSFQMVSQIVMVKVSIARLAQLRRGGGMRRTTTSTLNYQHMHGLDGKNSQFVKTATFASIVL
jgi:hypothetical protein